METSDNLPKLSEATVVRLLAAGMGGEIPQIRQDLATLALEVGVPVDSDEETIDAAALAKWTGACKP
jgi:hypothetical protein